MVGPSAKEKKSQTGKRRKINVACSNCAKSHSSCDSCRPCSRCIKKELQDSCVDKPRKKRKYLDGIPDVKLPNQLRSEEPVTVSANMTRQPSLSQEQQLFSDPQHIIHRSTFMSNAANSEYAILSNIISQDGGMINKIPVDVLYSNPNSNGNTNMGNSPNNMRRSLPQSPESESSMTARPIVYNNVSSTTRQHSANVPPQPYPSEYQNVYSLLLGPKSNQIVSSRINLFENHFPLVPVHGGGSSLSFKRLLTAKQPRGPELQYNKSINQYYLNNETLTFPEVMTRYKSTKQHTVSFALECRSDTGNTSGNNNAFTPRCNREWEHSLRYSSPMEIYTLINEPFCHTMGFRHLLLYLRNRFNQKDIVSMCRSMTEFRPIFIACSMTLTEEDMIFMEQCYQRTLLEYSKFIGQIGTPTCVWRRNGQISYINEEFEILTGWTREELLNKMTFIVEILDDDSVRDYFKTFSSVAYKDFKGCEQMKTCRLLTPLEGQVVNCGCMWTLKRDISGLPLMILGNFMPILP